MEVLEAIKARYSCRAYQAKAVEKEKLDRVIEAARLAPSAKNFQDWRFVFVTDAATRAKLCEAANNQKFVAEAAVVIAACSVNDHVMRCGQAVGPIDVSIALEHIALAAADLGLATCWIGSFFPDKVRAILGIPQDVAIIELMTLGYPADKRPTPRRMAANEIVCFDKWSFR